MIQNVLLLIFMLSISNSMKINSKLEAQSEHQARILLARFSPYFAMHHSMNYYPQSIDNFNVDWSKAKYHDKNQNLEFSDKGKTYDRNAPLYCSVKTLANGDIRLTYNLLYKYNGCGAKLYLKAKVGGKKVYDGKYDICPIGEHYLDKQYVLITLASNKRTVKQVKLSYHSHEHVFSGKSGLRWHYNHPYVYLARGSHASYPKAGDITYETLFRDKKNGGKNMIEGVLKDHTSSRGLLFKSNRLRLLKYEGTMVNGISEAERQYGFDYWGKLGKYQENGKSHSPAYKSLKSLCRKLKKVGLKNWGKKVCSAAESLKKPFDGVPGNTPANKKWWRDY